MGSAALPWREITVELHLAFSESLPFTWSQEILLGPSSGEYGWLMPESCVDWSLEEYLIAFPWKKARQHVFGTLWTTVLCLRFITRCTKKSRDRLFQSCSSDSPVVSCLTVFLLHSVWHQGAINAHETNSFPTEIAVFGLVWAYS